MPLEQSLNAETMRIVVQLRRLLQQDHGMKIDIEDPHIMEHLIDAAREARDKKAEQLAFTLCDHLMSLHYRIDGTSCRERMAPNFRRPLHEKLVGANPRRVYRGQAMEDDPRRTPRQEAMENKPEGKVVIYRGQRVMV